MQEFKEVFELKEYIFHTLGPLLSHADCVLLDTPYHRNIGDHLIFQGEIDFLSEMKCNLLYSTPWMYNLPKVTNDTIILLHGGGNFGDLYPKHQRYREKVIQSYPSNTIIVFPQSAHFNSKQALIESAEIFNAHPSIVLCARDQFTFDLFQEHFHSCESILIPDMAFCIKGENLVSNVEESNRSLYFKRVDGELGKDPPFLNQESFDIEDWPNFKKDGFEEIQRKILNALNIRLTNVLLNMNLIPKTVDLDFGVLKVGSRSEIIQTGIDFLMKYSKIYSTRLHGHILALLLDKKSIIIDNSYGKNSRFYHTWLKNIPNSELYDEKK
ncbi:MAG: polysaccharide pyruvyl transferase family protein [Ekhidna sp.]